MSIRDLVLFLLLGTAVVACTSEQQQVCEHLEEQYQAWASEAFDYDPELYDIEVFYSKNLDACIHADFAHVGVRSQIRDLSATVLRDYVLEYPSLMYCDQDWAYRARPEAVREYGGNVGNVDYDKWQVRYNPEEPHTREDCRRIFEEALDSYR